MSMPSRASLLLALTGIAACSAPPPAPPAPIVEMPPIVSEAPPPDPTQPLLLPRSPVRPPWREDPVASRSDPFYGVRLVEAGQKAALVRTGAGELFSLHEDRGVQGPLATPAGAKWIGTDDQDRVYAATPAGELWIAEGPEDAAQGKFSRAGAVEGARDWDFSAGIVVAAQRDKVLVSTDRGATFTASSPRKGTEVRAVFARFDGMVAVRLEAPRSKTGDVYLSRDRGKTWRRSSFTPYNLRRDGAWIWDGGAECAAVLTADGRGFTVDQEAHQAFGTLRNWTRMLDVSETPEEAWRGPRLHLTTPLPPATTTGKGRKDPARCPGEDHRFEAGGLGLLGTLSGGEKPCGGAACIAGTVDGVPPATRTGLGFFHDGVCQVEPSRGDHCPPGTPFARLPQVARIDQVSGQVRVGTLPAGCDPAAIHSVGGLGLLFCRSGDQATAVFTSPPGGAWTTEGTIPVPPADVWATTQSADGSVMLHVTCPRGAPCRAVVRAPRPPGDASAWRTLTVPGAFVYRILDDGAALAIAPGTTDQRFSLLLATPGAAPKPLATDVDAGERQLHDLGVDAEGRVVVKGSLPKSRTQSWMVSAAGTLIPAPTAETPRPRGQAIEVTPRPLDPARWP